MPADNVSVIQAIYEAFGRGDIAAIVERLTPDVRWVTHVDSVIPWSGDFSGQQRVPEFFSSMMKAVDVLAFVPQEFVCEGNTVVSMGEFGCRVKATGRDSRTRWVFVWKLQDGKVCSYEQFHQPGLAEAFQPALSRT